MQTDPAIKAALSEAEAVLSEWLIDATGRPRVPTQQDRPKIVAAVTSAFLRALPDHWFGYERVGTDFEGAVIIAGCTDLHEIAAAVERAAQEARDGK